MIEAEWLGGPEDGAVLALPDDTPFVVTAHPPAFVWHEEAQSPAEVELNERYHRVRRFSGKWYIVW